MTKISKVPYSILKDRNHPIIPKDATDEDISFIEEGEKSYIVFQTTYGSVVFDNSCNLIKFRQDKSVFGVVESSEEQAIGSSIWESATEILMNYIKANNK